jgi:hypothetical protein
MIVAFDEAIPWNKNYKVLTKIRKEMGLAIHNIPLFKSLIHDFHL